MLTSKGASGVTGAGFITLAATLTVVNPALVPGMAIVFSVDKFMSEVRALTNITGNGVATVFVSWWEGELDHDRLHANLNQTSRSVRPADRGDDGVASSAGGAARVGRGDGMWRGGKEPSPVVRRAGSRTLTHQKNRPVLPGGFLFSESALLFAVAKTP